MRKTASSGWSSLMFFAVLLPHFAWGQENWLSYVNYYRALAALPSFTALLHESLKCLCFQALTKNDQKR
jgi:hypothetical protein